jgi:AraC-like DNA-binding protein
MATIRILLSEIDLSSDLRPVRVSAGEVTYPPGGRLGPRWQHDVELVLVHTGSARIAIDGGAPLAVAPDHVALLVPGHREEFEFDAHQATRHSWVQVGLAGEVPAVVSEAPRVLWTSAVLGDLVQQAVVALRGPASTAHRLAGALGVAAIWQYAADAHAPGDEALDPVELARRHLDVRLADPSLSLANVAAVAHVAPAHLVRRFKADLGITPMAYLWQRRVAAGVELLVNTGLPVGEIARRAGFRSVYHFSRRVKAARGLSPTEVRRQGWSQTRPAVEYGDE